MASRHLIMVDGYVVIFTMTLIVQLCKSLELFSYVAQLCLGRYELLIASDARDTA